MSTQGHLIWYRDNDGNEHEFSFSEDLDALLDTKVLHDGKSLREVWTKATEFELSPEFF